MRMLQSNKLSEKYIQEIQKQCRKHVLTHYHRKKNTNTYEINDIVQEMLLIVWKSFCSGNGLSKIIAEKKLIPTWQIELIFLNALRNLDLLDETQLHHPEPAKPAKVIRDENSEIVDFYYPFTFTPEQEEAEDTKKSKVPPGRERERWLERIRRLKELGYSDQKIVEMLKPAKQGVLF